MPNLRLALLLLLAARLHAGVIQGVVLEYQSGRPLARTEVRLEPIAGQSGVESREGRANSAGHFVFTGVAPGLYMVRAERSAFFPAAFGQRRPTGQGTPVRVTADSDLFAELRMRRMGAITGRVLDENGVGIQGVQVFAYPSQLPTRSVANATTDDRGVYRISSLGAGKYWVRTGAYRLEDGSGILPTFGPQSREVRDARVHEVRIDSETPDANVQPEFGSLLRLSGRIFCDNPNPPAVEVTITSETLRRTTRSSCNGGYVFENLAPAPYEVFAQFVDGTGSGFVELQLEQSGELGNVQLLAPPQVDFEVRSAESGASLQTRVTLLGLRNDLSVAPPKLIAFPRAQMAPGHWELHATVNPNQYVQSITTLPAERRRPWREQRPINAFDIFIEPRRLSRVQIRVSERPARISGTVTNNNGDPVAGALVFVRPVNEDARRALWGGYKYETDTGGHYRLEGLPPGSYRLLATFDYTQSTDDMFDEGRARTIAVGASEVTTVDLVLWTAP